MKLHSSPVVAVLVAGAALATLAANAHQNEADDDEEEADAAAASVDFESISADTIAQLPTRTFRIAQCAPQWFCNQTRQ